ncbi:protein-export chaperone SecB [Aeromonas hydrophila]|uniref:protein-export chaperone SecB n=1 Tax=Aeromonas hydrophila TaxID=644 RepID=UPI0039893D27
MNIQIKESILDFFKLQRTHDWSDDTTDVEEHSNNGELSFGFSPEFYEEDNVSYDIVFNITFKHREGVEITMAYRAHFTTDSEITDEFRESQFVFVNSPAIAYPFLRAYLANMLLMSGYEPMMLPTINFQKLYNDRKAKEKQE